jgi:hypothetical protein
MDPNLFHVDWERTLEALVAIIILSFLVERVSALLFEARFFAHNTKVPQEDTPEALREIAVASVAREILEAGDSEAKTKSAMRKLDPSNPLWPGTDVKIPELQERAQAVLRRARELRERRQRLSGTPIKELIAFLLAASVCIALKFDAFSIILLSERTTFIGAIATGAVVAGGSKASIRLFHDLLGIKSQAMREIRDVKETKESKQ